MEKMYNILMTKNALRTQNYPVENNITGSLYNIFEVIKFIHIVV
jgi:hypothetical protein